MRAVLWSRWARAVAGENVGICLPSSATAVVVNFGITLGGKTAVNLNFTLGQDNLKYAIDLCEIRTLMTSRVFVQRAGLPLLPEMVFVEDVVLHRSRFLLVE